MSKSEILEEIAKLTPAERGELWEALWDLEERLLIDSGTPTDEEKAILEKELEEYRMDGQEGKPWEEIEERLRKSK
jgi:putative addiction module component (TIGR02574 family)